jgi:hypothetical protein
MRLQGGGWLAVIEWYFSWCRLQLRLRESLASSTPTAHIVCFFFSTAFPLQRSTVRPLEWTFPRSTSFASAHIRKLKALHAKKLKAGS